ncbi:hypothetical protein ACS3UN_09255 [Oscillospiraceae bacterium LTW-04]|nr:hypothetical protein RBH76_11015 [Oscillospiraceae bacterium MB24-C1]
MKIKPQIAVIVTIAVFAFGITVTSVLGLWKTESSKIPAKFKEQQYSDQYNPADIRGSYTFSEISRLYDIPSEDLFAAFGIDATQKPDFKCKDLESIYGDSEFEVGTSSVKMFAAYYLGLPYEPSEESFLPDSAANILNEKGNMTESQREYLSNHTVPSD